ncbi:MAG: hypothetical protein PVJ50_02130 [Desulfobacterales bacterium]|jgi:hypothetical protein
MSRSLKIINFLILFLIIIPGIVFAGQYKVAQDLARKEKLNIWGVSLDR